MQIMKTAKQYTINFFSQSFTKVGRKHHYSICPHSKYKTEQLVSIFHTWFGKRWKWIRLVDKPKLWSCPQLVWMISQLQLPCKLECTHRNAPSVFTPFLILLQTTKWRQCHLGGSCSSVTEIQCCTIYGAFVFLCIFSASHTKKHALPLILKSMAMLVEGAPYSSQHYMTNSTFRKITEMLEPAHSLSKSSWARFCHIQSRKMHITFKIKILGASDGKQ